LSKYSALQNTAEVSGNAGAGVNLSAAELARDGGVVLVDSGLVGLLKEQIGQW
jgi:hypothetical protein